MPGRHTSRAGLQRLLIVAFVVPAATAGLAGVVAAQESQDAVAQLRSENVAFEDGALTSSELDELDEATAKLQADGYFKVIVLGEPITRYSDAGTYATSVRTGLGGQGRVLVFAPYSGNQTEVGMSSSLDSGAQVAEAEQAALDAYDGSGSYADATNAAARRLGGDVADKAEGGGGGSGIGGFLVVLLLLGLAVLGLMWWASRRMRKSAAAASAEEIGVAEAKVRAKVDEVANDLLDLADRVDQPGTPPEAKAAFAQGAELFTTTQELLEEADTRPELEAAYPKVVEAGWHMDTTRALLDGQPAPAEPEPDDLFPRVVVPAASEPATTAGVPAPRAQVPEPHYRQPGASPWITAAAMAAMAMLSQRGMSVPQTRPSMDDGAFGNWSSRLPSAPSSGRGRRRSGGVTSSQRRRGMTRR